MTSTINITYFESLPWFVRIYYHTLQITVNEGFFVKYFVFYYVSLMCTFLERQNIASLPCARIVPAELRREPSTVELCLSITKKFLLNVTLTGEIHSTKWASDD